MNNLIRTLLMPTIGAIALAATLVGSAAASDTYWITSGTHPINHWGNAEWRYSCPGGYVIGDSANPPAIPFVNNSSSGVSATLSGGGYGSQSINVQYVNWNWWGDQRVGITYACHLMPLPGLH